MVLEAKTPGADPKGLGRVFPVSLSREGGLPSDVILTVDSARQDWR